MNPFLGRALFPLRKGSEENQMDPVLSSYPITLDCPRTLLSYDAGTVV